MMPCCEKKGRRDPMRLPSPRPHPRFRETTVLAGSRLVRAPALVLMRVEGWSRGENESRVVRWPLARTGTAITTLVLSRSGHH
jgi:hypothetical protein